MLTEKEKMLAGELYDASDRALVQARTKTRDLIHVLNASRERDMELRRSITMQLFGMGGVSVNVQPPFYCDYGFNIFLGQKVYFNFRNQTTSTTVLLTVPVLPRSCFKGKVTETIQN